MAEAVKAGAAAIHFHTRDPHTGLSLSHFGKERVLLEKKLLDEIFSHFAPEEFDYRFDRTKALVKLFYQDYVSRSEAKRLLYGLDKFKEIILDFKGVKSIGQGFADEVFRVFKIAHPDKVIKIENLNPSLKPIIDHVVDNKF